MVHAALLLLMLEAVTTDLVFTISLKRSTQILQLSTSWLADYPIYWRHSGHCSALAHIANSGIFPAQSLKQGTKCRNSTTSNASGSLVGLSCFAESDNLFRRQVVPR